MTTASRGNAFFSWWQELLRDTAVTSWTLIRITLPILLAVKVLGDLGLVELIAGLLDPLMGLMGLPGSMGLVWATAMFTNLYAGMMVFAELTATTTVSTAQVTVLASLMLIAHSLPVELAISRKAGAGAGAIAVIRLLGALVYGMLLNQICRFFGLWQGEAVLLFDPLPVRAGYGSWLMGQGRNLLMIVLIIFCLLLVMRLLRLLRLLNLVEAALAPVLPWLGMSKKAAPVTVVGMVVGISYGGALIIREATSGRLGRWEIFNSLALMGLSHSLIEDTLLMATLGAKAGGILWGRLVFSLLVMALLVRLQKRRQRAGGETGLDRV